MLVHNSGPLSIESFVHFLLSYRATLTEIGAKPAQNWPRYTIKYKGIYTIVEEIHGNFEVGISNFGFTVVHVHQENPTWLRPRIQALG